MDENLQINHIDGNKQNNKKNNLELVTCSENNLHRYATGLADNPKGVRHSQAKYSEEMILNIKRMIKDGMSDSEIAKEYGINYRYVWEIRKEKKWSHLKLPFECQIK